MIKILFFIDGLSEGGAEKVLRNLVNNMDFEKYDITVHTMDKVDPQLYLDSRIHYKAVNKYSNSIVSRLFSYWFRLCAELKLAYSFFIKDDYDIEVAYLETLPTKLIAQSTNKKAAKIAWVHCDLSKKEEMKASISKVKKQYSYFDEIVCVSEDVEEGFRRLYGEDYTTTILNTVIDEEEVLKKANERAPEEHDKKTLLAIGRLTDQKNFSYLIDSCSVLKKRGVEFHLDILGEGPERNNLQQQIENLDLKEEVTLHGFVSNPYVWITNSDVVVCSSRYEGISSVIKEALILGKPVITTPCTGMKELLGNSEYGIIVDEAENGLADGITRFLESEATIELYTQKSIVRGKDFYKAKIIAETDTLFMDLMKKKRGSRGADR